MTKIEHEFLFLRVLRGSNVSRGHFQWFYEKKLKLWQNVFCLTKDKLKPLFFRIFVFENFKSLQGV